MRNPIEPTSYASVLRIPVTNNAAERDVRRMARGRMAWLFVGSDRGGERAAMMYSLIQTLRLNDVDPLALLTDVLAGIADLTQGKLHKLLPLELEAFATSRGNGNGRLMQRNKIASIKNIARVARELSKGEQLL